MVDASSSRWIPIALLVLWLGVSALIFYSWARRRKARGVSLTHGLTPAKAAPAGERAVGETAAGCASHGGICCGLHEVCEKGLPKRTENLYFDDEELDRFTGRKADSYTEAEIEEFRQVMHTTLPHELTEWARCLGRRGVTLPTALRSELLERMP